jgi:hypothetical protein
MLIFVQSIERAEELYGELKFDSIRVGVIHSNLSQEQVGVPFIWSSLHSLVINNVKKENQGRSWCPLLQGPSRTLLNLFHCL